MRICVVHPSVTKESANRLAKAIGAYTWNPYQGYPPGVAIDVWFNYGYGGSCPSVKYATRGKERINPPASVRVSTDKIKTYEAFVKAGVPTCEYVTNQKDIPKKWKWIVCRETINGRNCEGVTITQQENIVKDCPLYTKFFDHDEEHRIVVFKGQIVARYMKTNLKDGEYELTHMLEDGYSDIDKTAIQACRAVGLDYAGVDVLHSNHTGKHIALEINSGPLLTAEAEEFFINHFKG